MSELGTRRRVVGTAAVVVAVVIPPFLVGALATRIGQDLPFGTTQLGLALAACYIVTCVLSPLGGRFVACVGAVAALRIAGTMTTVGLLGIAAATRAEHLLLALAFIGIPNALTQPSSNEILSRVEEPRLRALSFGLVQASIPTASLIAGSILAIASYGTSWRGSMLAVAALTVAAQLVLPGTTSGPSGDAVRRHRTPTPVATADPRDLVGGWPLMAAVILTGCLASASATALPSFAATTGLAIGVAPWLVAGSQVAGSLTSILVRVIAPVATSHSTLRRRLLTVAALQCLGLFGMLAIATGTPAGFVVGSIAAFGFGWGWNGLFNLIVALARPGRIAAATGLTQAGVFLGGTVGPLSFAAIARGDHFGAGWVAMAAVMAVAVASAGCAAHRVGDASPAHRPQEVALT